VYSICENRETKAKIQHQLWAHAELWAHAHDSMTPYDQLQPLCGKIRRYALNSNILRVKTRKAYNRYALRSVVSEKQKISPVIQR
jgi:hypothetical protein